MHELLFHRQKQLGPAALSGYAEELGLDQDQLDRDLADKTLLERVREDAESAVASGARGTPTLFLNGTRYTGSYDRDVLRSALEALE